MNKLFEILIDLWVYDIQVLCNPWVLYPVIPALFYAFFMILKWVCISIPVWVPVKFLINLIRDK